MKEIWLDCDGTIVDFYGVDGWLTMLEAHDPTPYIIARPLLNLSKLARKLNKLQRAGYKLGIISWLSRSSNAEYDELVRLAKIGWLEKHLPSVKWNKIYIVAYGTSKWEICGRTGILFDDEERNRTAWLNGESYEPERIFDILSSLT